MFVGYILVFVGLAMIILAVLDWLGVLKRKAKQAPGEVQTKGIWHVLLELLKKAGWVAFIGLVLIYLGLKTLGVNLPF